MILETVAYFQPLKNQVPNIRVDAILYFFQVQTLNNIRWHLQNHFSGCRLKSWVHTLELQTQGDFHHLAFENDTLQFDKKKLWSTWIKVLQNRIKKIGKPFEEKRKIIEQKETKVMMTDFWHVKIKVITLYQFSAYFSFDKNFQRTCWKL